MPEKLRSENFVDTKLSREMCVDVLRHIDGRVVSLGYRGRE